MTDALKKAFLIPWYGPWPGWLSYFLKSCRMNPSFDWIFFTDNPHPEDLPANVIIHKYSLKDITDRAISLLHSPVQIVNPYKLVDLKPAYGLIFYDYIRDYHYWGYTDIDLVYGYMQQFLPDRLISEYDVISPSADFIPGHFSLFRNNEEMRNILKKAMNWQQVISSPKCHFFDEFLLEKGIDLMREQVYDFIRDKTLRHIREKKITSHIPFRKHIRKILPARQAAQTDTYDFNSVIRQSESAGNLSIYRKNLFRDEIINLIEGRKVTEIIWENGKLSEDNKEIMYFHFQLGKYTSGIRFTETPGKRDCFTLRADLSEW